MKGPELITKYCCESCAKRHDSESRAEECCPPQVSEVFICSVCRDEFFYIEAANEHMALPHTGKGVETVEDRYFEQVLIEGKPCLGLWAFELEEESRAAHV